MVDELLLADDGGGMASGGVLEIVCGVGAGIPPADEAFGGGGFRAGLVPGAGVVAWAAVAFLKGTSCGGPIEEGGGFAGVGGGGRMVSGCGPFGSAAKQLEILKR